MPDLSRRDLLRFGLAAGAVLPWGLASAAGVVSLAIGFVAYWVWARSEWLLAMPTIDPIGLDSMGFAIRGTLLAIGLWLVLAPVAVYLVASDD